MEKEEFRRINYFKGFFVQAEDLQNAEKYHIEKRRLHNRYLHTPGVVSNCLGELKVTASKDGTGVTVAPGCAIDGEGRELFLHSTYDLPLNPKDHNPPCTVYIIISYEEKKDSLRTDKENPDFTDYAFIAERPKCEVVTVAPDNRKVIELARINLSADATRVRNPADPDNPNDNEIDRRFVRYAAAAIRPPTLRDLGRIIIDDPQGVGVALEEDTNVLLEKITDETTQPFYLVSIHPIDPGVITWRIEARSTEDAVEYHLVFNNRGQAFAKIPYRVYRLSE